MAKLQGGAAGAPTAYGIVRCCNVPDANLEFHANYANSSSSTDSSQAVMVLNNQWHHIAGVFNGANLCFYMDGALVGCSGQITVLGNGPGPFSICASSDGPSGFFSGLVDGVRVYARELTAAEIRSHYTNP